MVFPDIKLGLHPGWGGTVRLARLLGGVDTLRMLLDGKSLSAKRAFELGLVDCLIPAEQTKRAVFYYTKIAPKPRSTQRYWLRKMSHWPGIRNIHCYRFSTPVTQKSQFNTLSRALPDY
ncbi:enoyl-CoA hydratase/isomerase family protein [Rickettsiella massiliensis]|uniref:enoyl-CoA hydratase/isomerase family protein n=1 Tax=Rickettsiella massiliensis TaxID=676517 RepID=UPI00029AB0F9|nr:enoyl-CoA hydratase/isomerase family protein [Rickettsiella massiliensis]